MKPLLLLLIPYLSVAQALDPEAKSIVTQISNYYGSLSSFTADFELTLDFPEQTPEVQKGTLTKSGNKFALALAAQTLFSDGQTLVTVMENNREVQLMNAAEMDAPGGLTPESIFNFYEQEPYEYAVIGNQTLHGKVLTAIEFKPLDKWSEYSKIRMTVDKKLNHIAFVEAFSKDGIAYTFTIKEFDGSPIIDEDIFTFDAEKYTGYHIEDLR